MNTASPSVPPKGVRIAMPIMAMRSKPLPPRSAEERDRWTAYIRRRPLPRRTWGVR